MMKMGGNDKESSICPNGNKRHMERKLADLRAHA